MENNIDIKKLDVDTLKFAKTIAWQYEFLCKKTKEGRTMAYAYGKVISTLEHYIQLAEENR